MDSALPDDLRAAIDAVLARHRADRIDFHDVRTREAGHERFVQLHMLVPGDWSVQRAHDLAETIEDELRAVVDVGITLAQGYHLGRPTDLQTIRRTTEVQAVWRHSSLAR